MSIFDEKKKVGMETKFYRKSKEEIARKKNIWFCGHIWTKQVTCKQ